MLMHEWADRTWCDHLGVVRRSLSTAARTQLRPRRIQRGAGPRFWANQLTGSLPSAVEQASLGGKWFIASSHFSSSRGLGIHAAAPMDSVAVPQDRQQ